MSAGVVWGPLGVLAVVGGFVGLIAALGSAPARRHLHPELRRKGVHVGMGLAAATFPWTLPDWPWFLLALVVIAGGLFALRRVPALAARQGGALHDVQRSSGGDAFFALAVLILYFAAAGEPALYLVPLLVLALADAAAALFGTFYAKARLASGKSWEGTILFFLVAFLAIHIPVLLMLPEFDRAESLLVSFCLAWVATSIEGASWQGLDNLFLPLTLYLLLASFLRTAAEVPPETLVGLVSCGMVIGLTCVGIWAARRFDLRGDAVMALVAFGFAFWGAGTFALVVLAAGAVALHLAVGRAATLAEARRTGAAPLDGREIVLLLGPASLAVIAARQGMAIDLHASAVAALAATLGVTLGGAQARSRGALWRGALGGFAAGTVAALLGWGLPPAQAPGPFLAAGAGTLGGLLAALTPAQGPGQERLALGLPTVVVLAMAALSLQLGDLGAPPG